MLTLLVLAAVIPAVLRLGRTVLRLHLYAVVLLLPGGLLLRHGGDHDLHAFALVTAGWGIALGAWRLRRALAARAAKGPDGPAGLRREPVRRPYRERLD